MTRSPESMTGKRKRSFYIHADGLALIEKRMIEKTYDRQQLAEKADLSVETVNRLLRGEPRQKATIQAIAKALDLQPTDLVDPAEWYPAKRSLKLPTVAIAEIDVTALIEEVREKIKASIYKYCGEMKVLDMTRPIGLDDIYTTVNILEKPTRLRGTRIAERLLNYDPDSDNHARYGLGRVISEAPISGLQAVQDYSKLMVLGKPGAGKTTFLKHLAIQCIEEQLLPDHIPIFITLKQFAEEKERLDLEPYINQLFAECGVMAEQISLLIQEGKALILLDGLDEVKEEDSDRVISQVQYLADRYGKNHFIITCRIAAYEYSFQGFTDVEVADFGDEEIKIFVGKWFQAKEEPELSDRFIEQLEDNPSVKDLATSPLLLTLLCIEFEDSGDLPSDRVSLYDRAIDTLLRRWDKKRGIERDRVYRDLTLKRKQDLLSHIALLTFERKEYFFRQRDLEHYIATYICNLSDAQADSNTLEIDSMVVLQSIVAQHGLFVERARGVYSFSHLTFHEYFAARKISTQFSKYSQEEKLSFAKHITEPRWREIFLLVVEMIDDSTELIQLIKKEIDSLIAEVSNLQDFLKWAKQKALDADIPEYLTALRIFYITLGLGVSCMIGNLPFLTDSLKLLHNFGFESLDNFKSTQCCEFHLMCVLSSAKSIEFLIKRDIKHSNISFDENIFNSSADIIDSDSLYSCNGLFILCKLTLKDAINTAFSELIRQELEQLKDEIPKLDINIAPNLDSFLVFFENEPKFYESLIEMVSWASINIEVWSNKLREIISRHCDVGLDWNFSKHQKELLEKYYEANSLLINCLSSSCYLNRKTRKEIEDTLFLPIAEIEKRKMS